MPFGMANAPATFQRMMNSLFKEELDAFVLVYLDDILVFSQMLEDHIRHIRTVLQKMRDASFSPVSTSVHSSKRKWSTWALMFRDTGYNPAHKRSGQPSNGRSRGQ